MAIKQDTKHWADSVLEDLRSSSRSRKSAKHRRVVGVEERRDGPLNVLGCLALIHAIIRSVNSGDGPQVCPGAGNGDVRLLQGSGPVSNFRYRYVPDLQT
jgi:hypothetical protein